MWRALKIFVEEELADDVAGPVHDNNQHAEVVSGPVITLGVQSETSCFTNQSPVLCEASSDVAGLIVPCSNLDSLI